MVDLCLDLRYCLLHFNRRIHSYSEAFLSMFFFRPRTTDCGGQAFENRFKLFLCIFTCLHTLHFFSIPSSNKSISIASSFPLHTIHQRHLAPSIGSKQTILPVDNKKRALFRRLHSRFLFVSSPHFEVLVEVILESTSIINVVQIARLELGFL